MCMPIILMLDGDIHAGGMDMDIMVHHGSIMSDMQTTMVPVGDVLGVEELRHAVDIVGSIMMIYV